MNCPMNGLWNIDNVLYWGIIYPKENLYVDLFDEMEDYTIIIFFLSPRTSEKPNNPI